MTLYDSSIRLKKKTITLLLTKIPQKFTQTTKTDCTFKDEKTFHFNNEWYMTVYRNTTYDASENQTRRPMYRKSIYSLFSKYYWKLLTPKIICVDIDFIFFLKLSELKEKIERLFWKINWKKKSEVK